MLTDYWKIDNSLTDTKLSEMKINIANNIISFRNLNEYLKQGLIMHYKKFLSKDKPHITIVVHHRDFEKSNCRSVIFSCKNFTVKIYKDKFIIIFDGGSKAYFDKYLKKIDFFINDPQGVNLKYLLTEIVMSILLSQQRGVIIHACGIVNNNKGYLFVGADSTGKSTIASLSKGKKILNDDRVIIKEENGLFRIYATPWPGEIKNIKNESAVLDKIFFLKKCSRNYMKLLRPVDAFIELIKNSFYIPCRITNMKNILDFSLNLSNNISCSILNFKPTPDFWNIIKRS